MFSRLSYFFAILLFLCQPAFGQLKGDINNDGVVNDQDATELALRLSADTGYYDFKADLDGMGNGDGISGNNTVDAYDLYRLKKCLARPTHCTQPSDWDERFPLRKFTLDMKCKTPPISCTTDPTNPDCGKCPVAVTTYNTLPYNEAYQFQNINFTETTAANKIWKADYQRKGFSTTGQGVFFT